MKISSQRLRIAIINIDAPREAHPAQSKKRILTSLPSG
jgi:hypothetical protein